jgi:ADP-ribosylglycohydrolase
MRVAPLGAFFSGDPARASSEAAKSAEITHAHPEGIAGAVAVAVAAAVIGDLGPRPGKAFLGEMRSYIPDSETRRRIALSISIDPEDRERAASILGTGFEVAAFDTVPFCLWICAFHSGSYEEALTAAAGGRGDVDTICAITGGIVSLVSPVPAEWIARREPLPAPY